MYLDEGVLHNGVEFGHGARFDAKGLGRGKKPRFRAHFDVYSAR